MPPSDPIREVYEKFKHLDGLFSHLPELVPDEPVSAMDFAVGALWAATKARVEARCVWMLERDLDGSEIAWHTTCGTAFCWFENDGGLAANSYVHCPLCGAPIAEEDPDKHRWDADDE